LSGRKTVVQDADNLDIYLSDIAWWKKWRPKVPEVFAPEAGW
jgi:hypothetical protein